MGSRLHAPHPRIATAHWKRGVRGRWHPSASRDSLGSREPGIEAIVLSSLPQAGVGGEGGGRGGLNTVIPNSVSSFLLHPTLSCPSNPASAPLSPHPAWVGTGVCDVAGGPKPSPGGHGAAPEQPPAEGGRAALMPCM